MAIPQILVVLWVTGGAHLVRDRGTDTSPLKLCQNPESSSDECFVGSNAAVHTSVIVWTHIVSTSWS